MVFILKIKLYNQYILTSFFFSNAVTNVRFCVIPHADTGIDPADLVDPTDSQFTNALADIDKVPYTGVTKQPDGDSNVSTKLWH